ncbi:unnamed protein product [Rotaria magnacalcarata]|uniref:RRM domain-containing protein n=5 Tax=Rotaria magnacalcarata TaxID=392030 RepID=A0A816LVG4_9BILA|nr:unnamed protein product [Rotaria magnacalcarata]CAF2131792.1 unnamed protein product [Rotaria magnacalcarata]CAF3743654.1 unnamed protein product [Rotaria magnacalcarata]CAF3745163.1 unnamed protein product [Rotaria magnacalcarata]
MDKRFYSNSSRHMSGPRQNMHQQRGSNNNNYMSMNNRNNSNTNNMGGYSSGQGVKRMRGDDSRSDSLSAPHRMKWDSLEEDHNVKFLERNDIDQRSEAHGQFTNITLNETAVLCFTVQNAKYPITLDVMRKICAITGQVLRICILRKRILQVLIEFDSMDTARKVKDELDGADIYSGCCTLKIEFANLKHLVVRGNDQDNLDLTVDENRYGRRKTLLSSPPRVDRFEPPILGNESFASNTRFPSAALQPELDRFLNRSSSSFASTHDRPSSRDEPGSFHHQQQQQQLFNNNPHLIAQQLDTLDHQQRLLPYSVGSNRFREASPPPSSNPIEKSDCCVFNVEGLSSPSWNCERLFNLLCLYGNVLRVKFLKSKEGGAMIQMNHCENLRQHLKSLNSTFIFGQTFIIVPSRQLEIQHMTRPFPLENGEPSYMEFDTNRNNRYLTSDQAIKNRPVAPSHVLYYFNTPPNMLEVDIVRFFEDLGAKRPVKVKNFPPRKESHHDRNRRGNSQPKGVTGLAEFRTITDACECLILANNYPIPHQSSNWPFFFKLTFSATPITDEDAQLGEEMDTSSATVTIENGRRHHREKSPDDGKRNGSSSEHRRRRHSSPPA